MENGEESVFGVKRRRKRFVHQFAEVFRFDKDALRLK